MPNPSNSDLVGEVWEREEGVTCVVCPACAFTFDAFHENQRDGGYLCPCCAEDRLAQQLEQAEQREDALLRGIDTAIAYGLAHNLDGLVTLMHIAQRAALTPDEGADPAETKPCGADPAPVPPLEWEDI